MDKAERVKYLLKLSKYYAGAKAWDEYKLIEQLTQKEGIDEMYITHDFGRGDWVLLKSGERIEY